MQYWVTILFPISDDIYEQSEKIDLFHIYINTENL